MTEPAIPVHEFFGAIYGHFFPDGQGRPSALSEAVHRALRDERAAGLAQPRAAGSPSAGRAGVLSRRRRATGGGTP